MKRKISYVLIICISLLSMFSFMSFAHSGRTDSSGGHHDYKNKSGLGSYHYHCGGYPPHLHQNGVCPYAPKDIISIQSYDPVMNMGDTQLVEYNVQSVNSYTSASITSSDNSIVNVRGSSLIAKNPGTATIIIQTDSAITTFNVTVQEVFVSNIELEISSKKLQVGEQMDLDVTINPENATNKSIVYTSSDNSIAEVGMNGRIYGKSKGTVTITATTSNNISKSVDIKVFEVVPKKIQCEDSINLIVGDTYDLQVEILPEKSNNKDFTVKTNNKEILECSDTSLKAVKEGETYIQIKTWNNIKRRFR